MDDVLAKKSKTTTVGKTKRERLKAVYMLNGLSKIVQWT